ncbi:unnamed protein product [Knipowitschia caucasica]
MKTGLKLKLSKRELEQLVDKEVQSVVSQRESSLDVLIENIRQQLGQGLNYETSIEMLQSQMMAVTRRAEHALAQIAQNSAASHCSTSSVQSQNNTEDCVEDSRVSEFMEKTRKQIERLHAESADLRAALAVITGPTTPSPTTISRRQDGVIDGLAKLIKKEPTEAEESSSLVVASGPVKRTTEELSNEQGRHSKRIKTEPEDSPYPPLPDLVFPPFLPSEASKYSLPPRVKAVLGFIKNPSPHLSLLWSLDEIVPNAPPMNLYSIFISTELAPGSGVFSSWQKLPDQTARTLPMSYENVKFKPGHKLCVTVVGLDKFGRYGPFSNLSCVDV